MDTIIEDKHSLAHLEQVVRKLFERLDVSELRRGPHPIPTGIGEIKIDDETLDVFGGLWAVACEITVTRKYLGGRGRKAKVPGFVVGVVVHHHNYPHEPDDYEPVETGQFESPYKAAEALALLYYQDRINSAMEDISMAEVAEQFHED